MNKRIIGTLTVVSILMACSNTSEQNEDRSPVEQTPTEQPSAESTSVIFPKGEPITNDNFVGTAWLTILVTADSTNDTAVGNVTFEPGARTNWHLHPDGQIILATQGVGYYQEEGSPKRILRKGDVVTCPPNVPHWHGASSDSAFVQLAITSRAAGPTEWLQAVSKEDYLR